MIELSEEDQKIGITIANKVECIWETSRDVFLYLQLKSIMKLGMIIGVNDLPFEKAMLYSWIREAEVGRKT